MIRQAVVFDLDGTLVDSRADIARSLAHMLAELGHPPRELGEIFSYIGDGLRMLVLRGLPEAARTEPEIERGLVVFRAHYKLHATDDTRPYPGIVLALDALRARGAALAVLTNKHGEAARQVIAQLGLEARFDLVLGGGDVPALKPDPSGLVACCERLAVAPADAWYVGDLPLDVATARGAGARVAVAAWGYGERGALEAARPDVVLAAASELAGLLG